MRKLSEPLVKINQPLPKDFWQSLGIAAALTLFVLAWWLLVAVAQAKGVDEEGVGIKYGCLSTEQVYVYASCKGVSQ